ncbi:MAG: AAA family ATPase [Candidatus Micrarchaeaceae archaeon]|jgi:adenylate kinase
MNRVVFVCGSPGAGKSSIVNGVAKNKHYKIVNVGTQIMKIALKKKYVKDRDELRFLSAKKVNELQVEAFKEITKMDGNIILDTHATIEQNGRYLPGFAMSHQQHLKNLVGFVYIDALTQDISRRRKGDKTRRRENERVELIDVQREINISIIAACSTYYDIPLYVVFNEQGELDLSVKEFSVHLKELFGV